MVANLKTAESKARSGTFPILLPESRRHRRVVVIGGGIAGLALALALRLYDARCQVTVLEKHAAPPSDRFGITLAPNGLEALATLGLLSRVVESGRRIEAFEVKSAAEGGRTARFDFGCLRCPIPYAVGILPRRLFDILAEELGADSGACFNHEVKEIRRLGSEGPYEVVTRSHGQERLFPADIVVGADGVHSEVRPYVTRAAAKIEVDEAYQIILGRGIDDLQSVQQHLAPGRLLGLVPVASDRTFIFWFCRRGELQRIREQPLEDFKQLLMRHAPVLEGALRGLDDWSEVFPTAVTLTSSRRWFVGGIVLIGDTVHATTPSLAQGANMALVDALGLGARLAAWSHEGEPGSLARHLRAFVAQRRAQVRAQHYLGRMIVRSNRLSSPLLTGVKLAGLELLGRWSPMRRMILETLTGLRP
jgi:2-polyprenyl-6-methoxyphenol hydroxylase-like FAD-dependent oxidoreductase